MPNANSKSVDTYIDSYPKDIQGILRTLQEKIREEVEGAEEVISYGVPTFKLHGKYVVYFAAFKQHISIYPASDAMIKEIPQAADFRKGKGTLQFPLDKPLPYPLIRKTVKFLLKQNLERTKK